MSRGTFIYQLLDLWCKNNTILEGATTFSLTTFSIMTLSIRANENVTLSIIAELLYSVLLMPSVASKPFMLDVIMLNVIMLNVMAAI